MPTNTKQNLTLITISHAVVDLSCNLILFLSFFQESIKGEWIFFAALLYIILAFGTQPLAGIIIDYFQKPYSAIKISLVLICISILLFNSSVWLAIIISGLANSVFHVGAGIVAYNTTPFKATGPGIYVSSGALGLFLGIYLGKSGQLDAMNILLGAIIVLLLILHYLPKIETNYNKEKTEPQNILWLAGGLLFVVGARSLVGLSLGFAWKSQLILLFSLTLAVMFGKLFSGIIADRFGWIKTACIGMLVAIPLLLLGYDYPIAGLVGAFAYQMSMPITLVAMYLLLPKKPGLAFGLPCAALMFGALIVYFDFSKVVEHFIPIIILAQTIVLYFSLSKIYKLLKINND